MDAGDTYGSRGNQRMLRPQTQIVGQELAPPMQGDVSRWAMVIEVNKPLDPVQGNFTSLQFFGYPFQNFHSNIETSFLTGRRVR